MISRSSPLHTWLELAISPGGTLDGPLTLPFQTNSGSQHRSSRARKVNHKEHDVLSRGLIDDRRKIELRDSFQNGIRELIRQQQVKRDRWQQEPLPRLMLLIRLHCAHR